MSSTLLPPAITIRSDVLAAVDTSPENIINQTTYPTDGGYTFPDPGVFVNCTNEEKKTQYLHKRLQLRNTFIYHLTTAVLFDAPQIPAGMHPFRWIPLDSTGIGWIPAEGSWNPVEWAWIPLDCDRRDLYKCL